jgi:ferredoxin
MMSAARPVYSVLAKGCVRCAACSTLAPAIFAMGDATAFILRQPATEDEVALAEAALFNCPTLAIRKRSPHAE